MRELSAPIFAFGATQHLPIEDSHVRGPVPTGLLAMTGPSVRTDPGHLPVRGDLAHIRLAGRYFVPHYAVPMPHRAKAGAVLRQIGRDDGDIICTIPEGALFDVLDIVAGWAWGQLGDEGPVGYVALSTLEAIV